MLVLFRKSVDFIKNIRTFDRNLVVLGGKTTIKNVPLINSQCVKYARIQVFTDASFPV